MTPLRLLPNRDKQLLPHPWGWDTLPRALALALAIVLSACAERGVQTPALASIDASKWSGQQSDFKARIQSALTSQASSPASELPASNWWGLLGNPQLSALVLKALEHNPSLSLAKTRIDKAQALAGLSKSSTQAQLDAGLDVSRQLYSQTGIFPPPIAGNMINMGNLQAAVNWNPDLMGARAAQLKAAIGEVKAQEAQAHYAQLQLATQVTLTFINLASWVDQLDCAQQQLALQRESVDLLSQRVQRGLDNRIELTQAQSDLKDRESLINYIEDQVRLDQHQLALLSAQDPKELERLFPHLQSLKVPQWSAPIGLNLLAQRADLRAAQWRVEASLGQLESAQLDFYPNVNLGLFAGYNSIHLNQLLQGQSIQYGLAPSIRLPIFDGGRLRAQLLVRESERDSAIAQYNETLLEAVKACANALSEIQSLVPQLQQTTESLALSRQAQALASERAQHGLSNLQPLLVANRASLNKAQALVTLEAKQLSAHVTLINALGGGYNDPSAIALQSK
jgi:NodT family efflux transporter outer membrane factor (OMF) lipoprotein